MKGSEFADKAINKFGTPYATTTDSLYYTYQFDSYQIYKIENISINTPIIYNHGVTWYGDMASYPFANYYPRNLNKYEMREFEEGNLFCGLSPKYMAEKTNLEIIAQPNLLAWFLHLILIIFISATFVGSIRTIFSVSGNRDGSE